MPAGYVRIWISLGAAAEHVQCVAECDAREACEALLAALKDGQLRGRLAGGDQPLSVSHWYYATIYADGLVGFWEPPPAGLEPEHRLVEIHRGDLEAIWPPKDAQKTQPQADTDAPEPNERLTLPGPAIAEPETESGRVPGDAYTHSGFPGRPSKGKHLIDDEFDRRVAAREALPSLAEEAKVLFDWFKQEHPTLARPTIKTIKENIRLRHRQWTMTRPDTTTN
jgi:hypothetical protein